MRSQAPSARLPKALLSIALVCSTALAVSVPEGTRSARSASTTRSTSRSEGRARSAVTLTTAPHRAKSPAVDASGISTPPLSHLAADSTSSSSPERTWLASAAARCIEFHESTDGKLSPNLWQFQDGQWHITTGLPGSAGSYPVAVQDAAAFELFESRGWEPWSSRYVCGLG